MFLSRFGVNNYKCLGDIDIPLTPIHVLIGQNDSGKTSLMEAIAALSGSLEKPVEELFPQPWHGRQLVSFGAPDLTIEFRGQWLAGQHEKAGIKPSDGTAYGFSVRFESSREGCAIEARWMSLDEPTASGYENLRARISLTSGQPVQLEPDKESPWSRKGKELRETMELQRRKQREDGLRRLTEILKPIEKYALDPPVMKTPAALRPKAEFSLRSSRLWAIDAARRYS